MIKIDPPTLNDIFDPKNFSDWMTNIDYYFEWYMFIENSRVRFARDETYSVS